MKLRSALALGLGFLLVACGDDGTQSSRKTFAELADRGSADESERTERNDPPVVRNVRIEPAEPVPGGRVRALVDLDEPDGDSFAIGFTWKAGGELLGRGASSVELPSDLSPGDRVEVTVVVGDGLAESEPVRASVAVANRRPRMQSLAIAPKGVIVPGETIVVTPTATDPDGQALEYEFSWTVNGESWEPDAWDAPPNRLPTAGLRKGDRVEVSVVARDGAGARSRPLPTGPITLGAAPPEILSAPSGYDGGQFRYVVEARDPQGGPLSFHLRKAPEGMRIDPQRGEVRWRPRLDQTGSHAVEIVVENAEGTRAIQAFELDVAQEQAHESAS